MTFFRWYNLLDTKLLTRSIKKYTEGFVQQWGVNIHNFLSLPGVAQYLSFASYKKDAYPIYSFAPEFSHLNFEIRKQLFGGMTMCFSRLMIVKGKDKILKKHSLYMVPIIENEKNLLYFQRFYL